jgi:hypothetical protein
MAVKRATQKQELFFNKVVENTSLGNPKPLGTLARESGYGKISLQTGRIIDSKGFQSLLNTIDDISIISRINEIMNDDDKRSSLTAADMLLKLKNRYPDQTTKAIGLFGVIEGLQKQNGEKDLE